MGLRSELTFVVRRYALGPGLTVCQRTRMGGNRPPVANTNSMMWNPPRAKSEGLEEDRPVAVRQYPQGKMPVLSLFSGAGGLDTGFEQAGFWVPLALDIFPAAVETYRYNHPETLVVQADLSDVSEDEIMSYWREAAGEVAPVGLIGGPPCQSFSVSNVHQRDDDPRHDLPGHYTRILRLFHDGPGLDFFLFENVPGLLTKRHFPRFEAFVNECEEIGFTVAYKVLDAADFGVPQFRKRVFVLGVRKELCDGKHPGFPEGNLEPPTVWQTIGHLPPPVIHRRGMKPEEIPFHPNHWCLVPRSPKFSNGALKPGQMIGRSFRVLEWHKPSWTVAYGNREVHVHPNMKRRLSIYEAMLLQGFPEDYVLRGSISHQVDLVSDAVPPPLAKALATHIAKSLGLAEQEPMAMTGSWPRRRCHGG